MDAKKCETFRGIAKGLLLAWGIVMVALPSAALTQVSFSPATNFPVGAQPRSVAIGDLNADGKPDLAVANLNSNTVSVLLGTGTGAFGAATNFGVGSFPFSVTSSGPISVAIGDLNADGKPDLAVANLSGNNVSILLGDGTGTFSAATNFPAGNAPQSVAIGDLDGDGKPDLAVANANSNDVSILLGTGTGAFSAATNFPVGASPLSVAIGDLNGDGRPDLAVANRFSNGVSVLLGTGTGAFGAATNFPVGAQASSVAIGDLNGDGQPDLAVGTVFSGNNVSILLGDGTGAFSPATNFPAGASPFSVAIGDLNGDGRPDLAVANLFSNNVSILLNEVEATIVTINIKPGVFPNSINLGSNGTVPVAIMSSATFDATTVDPTTVTLAGAQVAVRGKGTPMTSVEDVNGDGLLDLVVHVSTEALQLSETDTQAILEGRTFAGMPIRGTDTIRVVP